MRTFLNNGSIRFDFSGDERTKVCTILEMECYRTAKHQFDKRLIVKTCDCLPDCTTITYNTEVSHAPYVDHLNQTAMEHRKFLFNQTGWVKIKFIWKIYKFMCKQTNKTIFPIVLKIKIINREHFRIDSEREAFLSSLSKKTILFWSIDRNRWRCQSLFRDVVVYWVSQWAFQCLAS